MNENKNRLDAGQEEAYAPNYLKSIAPLLIGLLTALAGDTALYFRWYAAALLLFVAFLITIVWIIRAQIRRERADYHLSRRISKALGEVESFENRIEKRVSTLETNIDLKADRPARSNIRPGSVQSDAFKSMMNERS
ncbi:MAG: hypothetical protein II163_00510 [Ruminococcus sp.]|nr:hypothetical protein [Ruminococcus sp.]